MTSKLFAWLAPQVGLEPTTLRLTAACSTDWAIEEYIELCASYLAAGPFHDLPVLKPGRLGKSQSSCLRLRFLRILAFPSSATGGGHARIS